MEIIHYPVSVAPVKDSALLLSAMRKLEEQIRQARVRSKGLGDPLRERMGAGTLG